MIFFGNGFGNGVLLSTQVSLLKSCSKTLSRFHDSGQGSQGLFFIDKQKNNKNNKQQNKLSFIDKNCCLSIGCLLSRVERLALK